MISILLLTKIWFIIIVSFNVLYLIIRFKKSVWASQVDLEYETWKVMQGLKTIGACITISIMFWLICYK